MSLVSTPKASRLGMEQPDLSKLSKDWVLVCDYEETAVGEGTSSLTWELPEKSSI